MHQTGTYKLIPVARRTTECLACAVEQWIMEMRSAPLCKHNIYPVIACIRTDNEASWQLRCEDWQDMCKGQSVQMIYVEPGERHAQENDFAEKAVQTAETAINAILMAHKLPPS